MNPDQKINCRNCKHFYITFESQVPYGCRLFKLKSRQHPYLVIKRESGHECHGFQEKNKHSEKTSNSKRQW